MNKPLSLWHCLVIQSLLVLAVSFLTYGQSASPTPQGSPQPPPTNSTPQKSGGNDTSPNRTERIGGTAEFKQILVVDHIESRNKTTFSVVPAKDIWLDLPTPIEYMDPIDCDIQYECTGATFELVQVGKPDWSSVETRLKALSELPMTECYEVENDYENHQTQYRCRFTRRITFEEDKFKRQSVRVLNKWRSVLKDEKILAIWIESGARVDSKGTPLEKLSTTRPIALLTDRNAYLVLEKVHPTAQFAKEIDVNGQRIFSFKNALDLKDSIGNVMRIFNEEIESNFSSTPLLARRATDVQQLDGELIFKREKEKSKVIGREFWLSSLSDFFNSAYELSTYTVKWNSSDNTSFGSSVEHGFFGKGAAKTFGSNIFLQIEHVFLISSDGVNYRENITPAAQMDAYLTLYKKAVDDAFKKALRNTCYRRLAGKGQLVNGTCEIRGDVQ